MIPCWEFLSYSGVDRNQGVMMSIEQIQTFYLMLLLMLIMIIELYYLGHPAAHVPLYHKWISKIYFRPKSYFKNYCKAKLLVLGSLLVTLLLNSFLWGSFSVQVPGSYHHHTEQLLFSIAFHIRPGLWKTSYTGKWKWRETAIELVLTAIELVYVSQFEQLLMPWMSPAHPAGFYFWLWSWAKGSSLEVTQKISVYICVVYRKSGRERKWWIYTIKAPFLWI